MVADEPVLAPVPADLFVASVALNVVLVLVAVPGTFARIRVPRALFSRASVSKGFWLMRYEFTFFNLP